MTKPPTLIALTREQLEKRLSASVTRYVVTHVNKDGMRTLAHAQQGRCTYATPEEAQAWIDAARANTSNNLQSVYPRPDTLEVRPCECWPVHFDPKGVWFD